MNWNSIVAGVDPSPEGAWAAATAWRLSRAAHASCLLVHAIPEVTIPSGGTPGVSDDAEFRAEMVRLAREQLLESLRGKLPPECSQEVEIRLGRAARVLASVAAERGAGLIVVGGKQHSVLGRWIAGSTAQDTVRMAEVSTLVATASTAEVRRILVAVDLSAAAGPTIARAQELAELFGAELRVLHVIEPVPVVPGVPVPVQLADLTAVTTEVLEADVWPQVTRHGAERLIRRGWPVAVIAEEAAAWDAHVVVVGSHGKGLVDRVLLGSVTERLLRELPASLLVVPVRAAAVREGRGRRAAHARA